jgi:GNAT superfamily N-acetyltransferase
MAARVQIRRAAAPDAALLWRLCVEHAAYERLEHPGGVDELAWALGTGSVLHAWIAMQDGAALGYASATLDFSTLDGATYLHMDCLFVRDGWRGLGIGRLLWQAVHAFAGERGCRNMQWQTPQWNADAARFYRRLGASEMIKRRYVLPLDRA